MASRKSKAETELLPERALQERILDAGWGMVEPAHEVRASLLDWAQDYLRSPHPELGPGGPVYPYVVQSPCSNALVVVAVPAESAGIPQRANEPVQRRLDWFAALPGTRLLRNFQAVLINLCCLPDDLACYTVDEVQRTIRGRPARLGFMIAEFHDRLQGSQRIPSFRPLRSPVLLADLRLMCVRASLSWPTIPITSPVFARSFSAPAEGELVKGGSG